MAAEILAAELTWTEHGFRPDLQVAIDDQGRIAAVGEGLHQQDDAGGGAPLRRLPRRALLPGFVNAHSHAFQRGLRGRGETFPDGAGSFWTWRQAMYGLVASLDGERLYRLCRLAFDEMLARGITTVGEFHYLHHDQYHDRGGDHAFDRVVLEAARDAGIRLVLLLTYYATGGIGKPLAGAQARFATPDGDAFWRRLDALAQSVDGDRQRLGVAAHSIRACPLDDLVALHAEARRRGLAVHMHVEEQRQEIEDCVAAYGHTPMALINDRLAVDDGFTAVHCTHTAAADMERFAAAGGNVCICPLTEANLGDGIAAVPAITAGGAGLCLGSDSNARIAMTEEMRWLEYVQRLAGERRGVLRDAGGQVARTLLAAATRGGARALGLDAGAIDAGRLADLTAIDLDAPSLAGATADTLLDALIFGAGDQAVREVMVGGRWQRPPAAPPGAGPTTQETTP